MERPTMHGEARQFLASAYDVAPAVMKAFGAYMDLEPATAPQDRSDKIGGFAVRRYSVTLEPDSPQSPRDTAELARSRLHDKRWTDWLAATHQPTAIEGHLTKRADTGVVVAGELTIKGIAMVDDKQTPFFVFMRYRVGALPDNTAFDLPQELVPARRQRTWLMIEQILGEYLSPAYERAPIPEQ